MARKTVVELIDDIDGRPAQETVSFSLDGMAYEIDLSEGNADRLRAGLAPFVERARKAGAARAAAPPRTAGASHPAPAGDRDRSAAIRAWAKGEGLAVNERGRIPAKVVEAFEAAEAGETSSAGDSSRDESVFGESPARRAPRNPIPQATFQSVSNP
jgi:hypothetical protein